MLVLKPTSADLENLMLSAGVKNISDLLPARLGVFEVVYVYVSVTTAVSVYVLVFVVVLVMAIFEPKYPPLSLN